MDHERRTLERAAASGDVDAEARLLVERLRGGDLPEGWLEAAARFGHEPARRALGRFVPFLLFERLGAVEAHLGGPLAVRLLVELLGQFDATLLPDAVLSATRRWTSDPSPDRTAALLAAVERPAPVGEEHFAQVGADLVLGNALHLRFAELVRAVARGEAAALEGPAGLLERWGFLRPSEERWREVRRALARFALEPPRGPAPRWPAEDDPRAAWAAAAAAFDAALASRAVRERSERLRERRKAKKLRRALLGLAADLGEPAAWLADRRGGRPLLDAPRTGDEVAGRLLGAVEGALAAERDRDEERQTTPAWAPDCAERVIASCAWPAADPLVAEARARWDGEDGPTPPEALRQLVIGAAHADPAATWERLRSDLAAWALGEAPPAVAPTPKGPARPYAPRDQYAVGDLVRHPKFGEGPVTRATKDKVDVAFADGPRTLVHGRGA